ncbi:MULTISPECIES: hypothetical protein [Pseudomonas]|uniref:Uncharacterized protein n=1 Tax=Pseudomonas fluorescens TaxID=294 RepID=A0A166QM54_PSEFL|nr:MULTISPECIES: hypothetical protein [Pseudomonas]KZN20501.1 hypothetical protein A1D17_02880 [Pseudomonas fluorescens]
MWYCIGTVLFALVLVAVAGFNMPNRAERLATDPGLAAICDSSDTSWKNVPHLAFACSERSKALLSQHWEKTYNAEKNPGA